ncbi:nucleotidyltransferase domain-containing protein [Rubrobacter tropicus]|uniref:nucleotidyltransferase domain-containing protein n=1 Tax=Rubrobacter tropicus TaxID=2653851 RepID=UPI00140BBD46|nr:nucleotidyltransferase family protein [Rubrobacter tropicus]
MELLLLCAGVRATAGATGRIETLLGGDLNWDRLLRAAYGHGVAPLLHSRLGGFSQAMPPEVLERLRAHFGVARARNLYLAGELLKLLGVLEGHGITALPYKGPVLAVSAYGDLSLREFGDLDVLVRRRDALGAKRALAALGYRPWSTLDPAQEAALLRYEREYPLTRENGTVVELHWTVAPAAVSFMLDCEEMWGRAVRAPFGGPGVRTLSPEDTLLVLCVHGTAHLWERLCWIRDVAGLLECPTGLDHELLLARARASNAKRALLLGLSLASDLLGAELPGNIRRAADADGKVRVLAARAHDRLHESLLASAVREGGTEGSERRAFQSSALDRHRDRLRYRIRRITAPGPADWEAVPLPEKLVPLYPLIRPIRLAARQGLRLMERRA